MITAYIKRDVECTEAYTEAFEWGRMGLIEREAVRFGLFVRRLRTRDPQTPAVFDWLLIDVPSGAQTANRVSPEENLKSFLEAIDDSDLGRMRLAVDTDEEREWIETAELEFVSLKDRRYI